MSLRGCLECLTWPCICSGLKSVKAQLEAARKDGECVLVDNPKRKGRVHTFTLPPAGVVRTWELDITDQSAKSTTKGARMELRSINGVDIDEVRRNPRSLAKKPKERGAWGQKFGDWEPVRKKASA